LKELSDKPLESDEVDVGVWVKKLKVDLDTALLNEFSGWSLRKQLKPVTVSVSLPSSSSSLFSCFRFGIYIVSNQT